MIQTVIFYFNPLSLTVNGHSQDKFTPIMSVEIFIDIFINETILFHLIKT